MGRFVRRVHDEGTGQYGNDTRNDLLQGTGGTYAGPHNRPVSPGAAPKMLPDVQIGDIVLETVRGRELRLRRLARPTAEQAELIAKPGNPGQSRFMCSNEFLQASQ